MAGGGKHNPETDQALRLMKLAFKAANAGAWDWNLETGQMFWTEECYDVLGLDHAITPDKDSFLSVIYEPDRAVVHEHIQEALSGKIRDFRNEHRIVKNGEIRWIEERGQVAVDSSGKVTSVVGISSDVTERKRLQEELEESQRWLSSVMDTVPEILFTVQPDGWSEFRNKRWLEYTGHKGAGAPGGEWIDRLHPDDRKRCVRKWVECADQNIPFDAEYRLRRFDGEYRWFRGQAFPVDYADGKTVRWFGISSDVHETKTLLQQLAGRSEDLERSQQTLAFAQSAARFGVWAWNITTGESVWSKELFELYRLDPTTTPPAFEHWAQTIHDDDRERIIHLTMESARQAKRLDMEYRTKDGRWMAGIGDVFAGPNSNAERMIGINIDITYLKRMEEDILRSNEELRRSNGDLQRFASVASHDLQEPLRVVSIFSEMLEAKYRGTDEKTDQYLTYIRGSVTRMQMLITDLLEYSRISHEGYEPPGFIDLQKPLEDALLALKVKIDETGALIEHHGLPQVRADRTLITQVFQNLVGNALKYRGAGTPRVEINAHCRDGEWIVSVKDNGIGFEARYAESIFGVFRRLHAKSKIEGTGIGLAIVKRIIERHQGRVWAESEPGKGSTFFFSLPAR